MNMHSPAIPALELSCGVQITCFPSAPTEADVSNDINCNDDRTEHVLHISRQCMRIQNRNEVVLHKSGAVTGLSSKPTEVILERSQRAHPAGELDERSPYRDRNVNVDQTRPAPQQKSPKYHERHEAEMEYHDHVCKETVDHSLTLPHPVPRA